MTEEKALIGFYRLKNEASKLEYILQDSNLQTKVLEELASKQPVLDRIVIIIEDEQHINFFGYTHNTADNGHAFEALRSRSPSLPARFQSSLGGSEENVCWLISDYVSSFKWDELSILYVGKNASKIKAELKKNFKLDAYDFNSSLQELNAKKEQPVPALQNANGQYVHLDFLAALTGMGYSRCRTLALASGIAYKVSTIGGKRHPLMAAAQDLDEAFDGYEWREGRFVEKSTGREVVTHETIDAALGIRSFRAGVGAGKLTELIISKHPKFTLHGCYKDQYDEYKNGHQEP